MLSRLNRERNVYGYNLAGQLTSLSEPSQFGSAVSYSYDVAGRLSAVNGSGFSGGVSHFASNAKYRAWGALSEISYGNGLKLNNGFNSRLLITSYQVKVPGTPIGQGERARSDYEYESDGRIKQAYDRTDEGFNRSYLYDHVGRLRDAKTLSAAYFQSFSYDEFDHMTVRGNGSWRYSDTTQMQYSNNRNTSTTIFPPGGQPQTTNWIYDAAGNVTNDHNKQYSYDAVGNKRLVFENSGTRLLWLSQDYDTDGERVKRVEQAQPSGGSATTVTSYYLRSSVLGRKVILELNESGQKRLSYVHANGTVIAQQKENFLQWVHVDPVTRSLRETGTDGSPGLRLEFDPLGNDAPLFDPAPPEDPSPDYEYLGNYGNSGNPYDGPSGCMIDGQCVPCSMAMQVLNLGSSRGIAASDGTAASATVLSQIWVDEWEEVPTAAGTATQNPNGDWSGSVTVQIRNVGRFIGLATTRISTALNLRPAAPQKPAHPETVKKAIYDCIQELWKGAVQLVSFDPTAKGKDGKASITIFNGAEIKEFATIHNSQKYSGAHLGFLYNATKGLTGVGTAARGLTLSGVYNIEGETFRFSPYVNYTASDVDRTEGYFPDLVKQTGDFQAVQIHELGNSIALLSGIDVGNPFDLDPDSGWQLGDCVARKF